MSRFVLFFAEFKKKKKKKKIFMAVQLMMNKKKPQTKVFLMKKCKASGAVLSIGYFTNCREQATFDILIF